jgi:hypothetical protein
MDKSSWRTVYQLAAEINFLGLFSILKEAGTRRPAVKSIDLRAGSQ